MLKPEKSARYCRDDVGNGYLFADYYRHCARYVPERGQWYVYDGKVWKADVKGLQVMELCKALGLELGQYAFSLADDQTSRAYIDFVKHWKSRSYRERILKDAEGVHPIAYAAFDADPMLFNCPNGTLDLLTMNLYPHRPEDLLTQISGVEYDLFARCDRWERFIEEVMCGDREKAQYLQKALGYALTGDTRHECFFILYGATSRNGKGTCMETIMRMLGDYGKTAKPDTITQRGTANGSGHSEDIARLAGARLVNISEPDKGMVLNSATVKTLTGNDTITARFLYAGSFEYRPGYKLFINTNHLP